MADKPLTVLVTNDDGIHADGLETLDIWVRYIHEVPRGPGPDVSGVERHRYRFELPPGLNRAASAVG